MARYQFQQQRAITPLAGRGMDIREQELQMRATIAYGRQELEAFKAARQSVQDELKIKQGLRKEKEVAAATAAVGKLTPESPTWLEDYSKIMASHPYAHDDKPLTALFHEQAQVHNAFLSQQIHESNTDYTSKTRREDEAYKAGIDIQVDKQKRKAGETESVHKELTAKAIKDGVNINDFTTFDENGEPTNTKWADLATSAATAISKVPSTGVIERAGKIQGELVTHNKNAEDYAAQAAKEKNSKQKAGLEYQATGSRNSAAGIVAEKASLKAAYPSLFPEDNPPAQGQPPPDISPGTPIKPPAPGASPTPAPTPGATPAATPKDDSNITSLFPK